MLPWRMQGLNTRNPENTVDNELDFQIQHHLIKIARDIEYSFINGNYQDSGGGSAVANRTRGLLELVGQSEHQNSVDADGEPLSADLLRRLYRNMADAGAAFSNMVMFVPAHQKQMLTESYANQMGMNLPISRTEGGVNITHVETDFFPMGIVWNRFMPEDSVLIADVAHIAPVFQEVPGKGLLFLEPLAKTGASERLQLFTQVGLAHGPAFLHGAIRNLATA